MKLPDISSVNDSVGIQFLIASATKLYRKLHSGITKPWWTGRCRTPEWCWDAFSFYRLSSYRLAAGPRNSFLQDLKSCVFSRWPEHPKANVSIESIRLLRHYWSPISSSFGYEAQSKAIFWYHEPQIYVKIQNSELMLRCFLIFNRLPSSDMIQKGPVPRNIFLQEKYLYSFDTYCKDLWDPASFLGDRTKQRQMSLNPSQCPVTTITISGNWLMSVFIIVFILFGFDSLFMVIEPASKVIVRCH